jgi:homoserine O-succinyltransferase
MPHSRWNEISESELTACGYRVLMRSEDAGAGMFVKQRKSLFVCFQGHPEYEARTLLLEYARDVRRYLRRESDTYPGMPRGYFGAEAVDAPLTTGARNSSPTSRMAWPKEISRTAGAPQRYASTAIG